MTHLRKLHDNMKVKSRFLGFSLSLIVVGCAGHQSSHFTPIEGGFGYITHRDRVIDASLSAALCYQDATGNTTVVWPHLSLINGDNPIITNNVAFLVGGKTLEYTDGDEHLTRLTQRLFVFEAPSGPPMDITDQVLKRYYAGTGFGLTNFMWDSFSSLRKTNDSIRIAFVSTKLLPGSAHHWQPFDSWATISLSDIKAIMKDVRANGTLQKEKSSGIQYLEEE